VWFSFYFLLVKKPDIRRDEKDLNENVKSVLGSEGNQNHEMSNELLSW
jgi:hypothetical protein